MVSVSVDNTPVSVLIAYQETVTVPTGETWVVQTEGSGAFEVEINGASDALGEKSGQLVLEEGTDLYVATSPSTSSSLLVSGWVV